MSLTSEQLNYLVWRYLEEHGHALSALAVGRECGVEPKPADDASAAPPGELVRLVLKGLQLCAVEAELAAEPLAESAKLERRAQLAGARCVAGTAASLALGTSQGAIVDNGSAQLELAASSPVTALCAAQNVAVGTLGGQLRVWDQTGALLRNLVPPGASAPAPGSAAASALVHLEYNKTGSHLLSVDAAGCLRIWEGPTQISSSVRAQPVLAQWIGTRTLAVSSGRDVAVHKLDLAHATAEFHGHQAAISALKFDSSSQLLATGADDGSVNIWHGRSQHAIRTLSARGAVLALEWLPAAPLKAVNVEDPIIESRLLVGLANSVQLYDLASSQVLWTQHIETPPLLFAAAHAEHVAVAAADTVQVFSLQGDLVATARMAGPVTGLLWHKNELVATAGPESAVFRV